MARIFIAVDLPLAVGEYVKSMQDIFKKGDFLNANYIAQKNLHITLLFLGERSEAEASLIIQEVSCLVFPPFSVTGLKFDLDRMPHPRVLWITILSTQLQLLAERLRVALAPGPEVQECFKPHVTIARIKEAYSVDDLLGVFHTFSQPLFSFEVLDIKVKSSILTPQGPVYTTLYSHPLRAEKGV